MFKRKLDHDLYNDDDDDIINKKHKESKGQLMMKRKKDNESSPQIQRWGGKEDFSSLDVLPPPVLRMIFLEIGYKDMFAVRVTCKKWLRLTNERHYMERMLKEKSDANIKPKYEGRGKRFELPLIPPFLEEKWNAGEWASVFRIKHMLDKKESKEGKLTRWARRVNCNSIFEGAFKDGKKDGMGMFNIFETITKLGEEKDEYERGGFYIGEFKDDIPHGMGEFIFGDGRKYVGMFDRGESNGKGVFKFPDGEIREGEFSSGKLDGLGRISFKSGDIHEGVFKEGELYGTGRIVFQDGEIHEGVFKEGELIKGKVFFKDGMISEGTFEMGELDGVGKMLFKDGEVHEGIFKNGEIINGKIKYPEGVVHSGGFIDGKLNGPLGCVTFKNGEIYRGEFEEGLLNGEGETIDIEGNKFRGTFKKGVRDGWGELILANNEIVKGYFSPINREKDIISKLINWDNNN